MIITYKYRSLKAMFTIRLCSTVVKHIEKKKNIFFEAYFLKVYIHP